MTTTHARLVITEHTTRAQIQAEITTVRNIQRREVIESSAREWDGELSRLLDALALLQPEQ